MACGMQSIGTILPRIEPKIQAVTKSRMDFVMRTFFITGQTLIQCTVPACAADRKQDYNCTDLSKKLLICGCAVHQLCTTPVTSFRMRSSSITSSPRILPITNVRTTAERFFTFKIRTMPIAMAAIPRVLFRAFFRESGRRVPSTTPRTAPRQVIKTSVVIPMGIVTVMCLLFMDQSG